MPAYIAVNDVKSLIASADPGDTSQDTLIGELIDDVMERVDNATGQYFASGYSGSYILNNYFEVKNGGYTLYVPRMESLDAIEYRYSIAGGWETVDDALYEGRTVYPNRWSGVDTIDLDVPVYGQVRVKGFIGWGNPNLTDDPVPARLLTEARKQVNYTKNRLAVSGPGGESVMMGSLQGEAVDWDFTRTMRALIRNLTDTRRLTR